MCGTFVFLPALNAVAGATMALRANAIGRCDLVRGWCDGLVRLGAIGDAIGDENAIGVGYSENASSLCYMLHMQYVLHICATYAMCVQV